ncbi:MAG: PTS sugar transporter subunit IIA [Verrucomicrobia bacterium]|nr:PTS sugar transporter subunit IIA [Verrucomicrobiota bacterium]
MYDPDEILTIKQVADYLKVNERAVYKLAQEGGIPTVKIANQWRFRRSMIDGWLDLQMSGHLTTSNGKTPPIATDGDLSLADVLRPKAVDLNLAATTKVDALDKVSGLLSEHYAVRDPIGFRQAVHNRERLCSTAIVEGVAFPHPRYNGSRFTREMALAVGRSEHGLDFGSIDGKPTHLIVMLCAPSDALHLRMIAKLGRLMADAELRRTLLAAPDAKAFIALIRDRESH